MAGSAILSVVFPPVISDIKECWLLHPHGAGWPVAEGFVFKADQ